MFLKLLVFCCILKGLASISNLVNLTFPDGRTFSFDSSHNYLIVSKTGSQTLSLTRIRLYNIDVEIMDLVFTASSINPSNLAGCEMHQTNGDQACYTKDDNSDDNPLIIVDAGSAIFDTVKLYNYGTTAEEKNRLATAEVEYWISKTSFFMISSPN